MSVHRNESKCHRQAFQQLNSQSFSHVIGWCFLKCALNTAVYQEILEHVTLPSAEELHGDAYFPFQQDSAPNHAAEGTKNWFNEHEGVTEFDLWANWPDLNTTEHPWGNKGKMEGSRPIKIEELKAINQNTLGFRPLHTMVHWCTKSCKRGPNHIVRTYSRLTFLH